MSLIREIFAFILIRRNFWLVPVILACGVLGGLVVLTHGSAVAPFIYTIF